jgi:hypothetical protein
MPGKALNMMTNKGADKILVVAVRPDHRAFCPKDEELRRQDNSRRKTESEISFD